jgi:hypothetical protein
MSDNKAARRVAILGGNRIPFARSDSAYANASNQDMFTAALTGLIDRFNLSGERLGAVVGGAVLKHSRDFNLMRESVLGTSLNPHTPAYDLQQACGTGLQSTIAVANGIALGQYDSGVAGGVDTTSDAPIAFGDDLRRVLLGLRRAKSNVDRLKLSASCPQRSASRSPPTASRAPVCRWVTTPPSRPRRWASSASTRTNWPPPATKTWPPLTTAASSTTSSHRSSGCTATTTCALTRPPKSWPSSSRCSA